MKKQFHIRTIIGTLLVITLCSILQSCNLSSNIIDENDIVYSTRRIKLRYICKDINKNSPLQHLEQTVVKEIKGNNETSYKIYDVLVLTSNSFKMEDKVFLIIDNEVYPLTIYGKEYENTKSITEDKKNVLTSDSTKISVVTGYSEDNTKITRFSYEITEEMISKIKKSNNVIFQYYTGPSMLSVKLWAYNLKMFKQLIDKI